ncbi:PqqD family protein [Bariatricus sp. HCP28S3_C2]|uniref:PqqD family protein n=1 Tax=unclassified Bariatricus TaxID=2677046 RepID=UPI003F898E7D
MSKYSINQNILYQRDYRIPENMSILDYVTSEIAEEEIKSGESTVLVISINEEIYEVNLVGAIIFEMIGDNFEENDILKKLKESFQIKEEELVECVEKFIQDMIQFDILQEGK